MCTCFFQRKHFMIVPILTNVNEYFFFWSGGLCTLLCEFFMYFLCFGSELCLLYATFGGGFNSKLFIKYLVCVAFKQSWNVSWNFVYLERQDFCICILSKWMTTIVCCSILVWYCLFHSPTTDLSGRCNFPYVFLQLYSLMFCQCSLLNWFH